MDLAELRERLWWELSDGTNIDAMAMLTAGHDVKLINAAIRDLADCLHIVKQDKTLVPDAGMVALPQDFLEVLYVKYKDCALQPVSNLWDIVEDTVKQYSLPRRGVMELHDAPPEDDGTPIHLWYRAYPNELDEDTDVPADVPREFHEKLVTVYAKAQFVRKFDYLLYQQLMNEWRILKKTLNGLVYARHNPVSNNARWEW